MVTVALQLKSVRHYKRRVGVVKEDNLVVMGEGVAYRDAMKLVEFMSWYNTLTIHRVH